MTSIVEQKQQRAGLIEQAEKMIDRADKGKRDFTASEQREYDQLTKRLSEATGQIRQRERAEQLERDSAGPAFHQPGVDDEEASAFLNGETRSLTMNIGTHARDTRAGLTVGSPTGGGATTPQSFIGQLYTHLVDASAIRRTNVTVHTTPDGRDLHIPKTTSHTSAEIIAEGATIPEDDPQFDEVVLGAFKYGRLLRVSGELVTDSGIDLANYLARSAGQAVGNTSGAHFINGSGSGQPQGVVTAATTGVTAAGTAAITADELQELFFSVIAPYRQNAFWMMNDATWAQIRQLKDNTERYLVGDLGTGASPQLLGKPVVLDPNMPAAGASAKPIVFGDFSSYHIRQHEQVRFERSDQHGFDTDQVVFRVLHRMDGRLVDDSGAIKALTMASA